MSTKAGQPQLATATLGIVVGLAARRQLIKGDTTALIIATLPFFTVYLPSVAILVPYAYPHYVAALVAGGAVIAVAIFFAVRTTFGLWGSPPHRVVDARLAAGASWRFSALGSNNQAISRAEQAIALCPKLATGYEALAHAYEKGGQIANALLAYKRGLVACPNDVNLLRGCAVLSYNEGRDHEASDCFQQLLGLTADDFSVRQGEPWIRASLAVTYQRLGRADEAVAQARRAVELSPNDSSYQEILRGLES